MKHTNSDVKLLDQERARMVLELWMVRAHRASNAHNMQASIHEYRNMWLTIINAIFAILVLYFSNAAWVRKLILGSEGGMGSLFFEVATGLLAALLVATTILQFIKRWSERSNLHKMAGANFSNIKNKIERYLVATEVNMQMVHNLNREINHASRIYPLVNKDIWKETANGELGARIRNLETCLRNADPNFEYPNQA